MSKHQEKVKVVDEACIATSSNIHENFEHGYWIHINHFLNCYPDCNIYLKSFGHFLKSGVINEQGLILIPLFHKILDISNVVCCLICGDQNCYICKNLKHVVDGRKSSCICNEGLRDDHAVNRINWFISNFKMCATIKERCSTSNSKFKASLQKNDNVKKPKGESGLKETNNKDIKSNVPNVNPECSSRLQCDDDCDESNAPSTSTGAIRKYGKAKVKLNESGSSKSQKINDGGNIREDKMKALLDAERIQAHLTCPVTSNINVGGKIKTCNSLACDMKLLTKDSCARFIEKFDSLHAFGDQCLFCKLLGYFYDGKYCDIIIPDFCIADRRQTTCEKSFNENDCFGKQYCLSVENAYVDAGVRPMLIGTYSKNKVPVIDLDKEINCENPKSKIIKKKKMRMVSCSEEMKKGEKKE